MRHGRQHTNWLLGSLLTR